MRAGGRGHRQRRHHDHAGTEVGSAPALECVFDDHDLLLGADINGIEPPSNFFAGALDDVRVYARALDADEVAELAAR